MRQPRAHRESLRGAQIRVFSRSGTRWSTTVARKQVYPLFSMTLRPALRVVGWNALLLLGGLALIALGGEAYFRLTTPFMTSRGPSHFIPGVGRLWKPYSEVRSTNRLDYWTISRTNRLGFLDRDPPSPARAAASCHLTMIGDSLVAATQVPIADKFHVRLEALAARDLPHLQITTSAFGRNNSGQVWQLALYDAYVRVLRPKLVVLVFVPNDFLNNSPILWALDMGEDPDRLPSPSAIRHPDGTLALRPPSPNPGWLPPFPPPSPQPWGFHATQKAIQLSWFAKWLAAKPNTKRWIPFRRALDWSQRISGRVELLGQRPRYATVLEGWQPITGSMVGMFAQAALPPVFADAVDYTAFALEQFKARAARDGARLVILASHRTKMRFWGTGIFDRLQALAAALGIPVIDQADYILRQGATLRDAQWRHDAHWNVTGHRWAAEALLEWLKQHPEVCAGAAAKGAP